MAADRNEQTNIRQRLRWPLLVLAAALLIAVMLYGYYVYPGTNIGIQQPIFFSHRVHAGVKEINCRFCHPFVARSEHAGLPPMEKCFFCHKYIIPTHPQLVKEKEHFESGNPVPWIKAYFVPDYVKFRHLPHIRWGKVDCTVCHGDVKTMDRFRPVNFQMGFCIKCHKEKKAQIDCWLACHH